MKVRFLSPARREFEEAVRYYESQKPDLGVDFRNEVKATLNRVVAHPQAWQSLAGDIRRCQMSRFPYGLIYESSATEVIVIAIAHLHREPGFWEQRVQ